MNLLSQHSALALSGAQWRKSSYSGNTGGDCVEVAQVDGHIAVRDSKHPANPALVFTGSAWSAFLSGVKSGEFNL